MGDEIQVARAKHLDIRSVWGNEAADFTPWLAEHLDWLSEDLGLGPLRCEATEVIIPGGRSLDILATDAEGRAVAIENQYGVIDHDHLTRGLAYAVALQSSDRSVAALIVIAEDHRDEFVAVAEYLNECAAARGDQGIRIFLVSVSVESVDGSMPAVRFNAVAEPNDWEAAVRQEQPRVLPDSQSFFNQLEADLAEPAERVTNDWEQRPDTWVAFGINSLVFYARNDRVPQGRCHVASLLGDQGGTLWLNPGRLRESHAFDEDEMIAFEQLLVRVLPPTTTIGGKGYYLAFPLREIDPAKVATLFDWILDRLGSDTE